MNLLIQDIIKHTIKNYGGRKIVIWGAHSTGKEIQKELETKYKVSVSFKIDRDRRKVDGTNVKEIESIKDKSEEYYIIVPLRNHDSIKITLSKYGYKKIKDYYYFYDCAVREEENYFEDLHGNKIYGRRGNVNFYFSGFNSIVKLDEELYGNDKINFYINSRSEIKIGKDFKAWGRVNFNIGENVTFALGEHFRLGNDLKTYGGICFTVCDNGILEIGDNFYLGNNSDITLDRDSQLNIGKNCYADEQFRIFSLKNTTTRIGDGFCIGTYGLIITPDYSEINIGDDCLLSFNVSLLGNDGHTIFDIKSRKAVNVEKGRKIIIGNHVWIGIKCTILYDTVIGDGSILGAGSITKSQIPNNCIAVGSPAKVIKRDIAWCVEDMSDDIEKCGGEYINLTKEL